MVKKFVLMAVACACVGSYTVAGAQGTFDVKPDPAKPVVAEQAAPMVGMPSPIHEFATINEAAKYMNIMPHLPKVLPVGYNIESVSTINKDVLQVVYVYQAGEDTTRNQAAGKRIVYRVCLLYTSIMLKNIEYIHFSVVIFRGILVLNREIYILYELM